MRHTQADLDRARMHVWEAERRIVEQRRRIAQRAREGLPTEESERLLATMLNLLEQMRWHAEEIAKEVKPDYFSN